MRYNNTGFDTTLDFAIKEEAETNVEWVNIQQDHAGKQRKCISFKVIVLKGPQRDECKLHAELTVNKKITFKIISKQKKTE